MPKLNWIDINLPFGPIYDDEFEELDSFHKRKLNKTGTLVEITIKDKPQVFLIGDINPLRGVCDDCVAFNNDVIVKRYRILNY